MPRNELTMRLQRAFSWRDEKPGPSGWWRDPELLRDIVAALAELHADAAPTVIIGVASRGSLLGPLVAQRLGLGFVEVRKHFHQHEGDIDEMYLTRATPPDYAQRDLMLALRKSLIGYGDRALLVDDWIATGAQAMTATRLVEDSGGACVGVAVIVDQTTAAVRRELAVRSLARVHDLSW